ncbi:MAG TPA: dienelactone hydrolase family protein [Nevskiaceae bacterium]|nr:dienelactone hydrolase family protein [Nevskiaceae bacterium]
MKYFAWILMLLACVPLHAQEHVHDGGDYSTRMAEQHRNDAPVASPAAQAKAQVAVSGSMVQYGDVDGAPVAGYLAFPVNHYQPLPGVLMFHEWWGLNDNIRSMARQLAAHGYVVLAADLYRGQVADRPDAAKPLMQDALAHPQQMQQNISAGYEYLRQHLHATRVGTLGWCFGGGVSLQAALLLGDRSSATVIYYGQLTDDADQLRKLHSPVLGLFGALDQGITVDSVKKFEAALQAQGRQPDIHIYPGAGHAFANPSGMAYQADAAQDAWRRTLAFLRQQLQR